MNDIISTTMDFSQFLQLKFLEWQKEQGGRRTAGQFAKYLGFPQSTLGMWWNDSRKPEGENIRRLAEKLGLEVYDVLGEPRPNEILYFIETIWNDLTEAEQKSIGEQAAKYATKKKK